MSTDRDTTRIVRSWLMTDEHESADRVLDTVLGQLDTTPQRRATWWPAGRTSIMNKLVTAGLAAAAVVVLVFVGAQLMGTPTGPGGPGTATPTPEPTVSQTATPQPTPIGLPVGEHVFTDGTALEGMATVPTTIDIAASGWEGDPGQPILVKGTENAPDGAGIIAFFGDLYVYGDPCAWSTTRPETPATTVDEVVAALAAQASRDASEPVDISVDGHAGKAITLHVPDDADFSTCDRQTFGSWGLPGDDLAPFRFHQDPGQIDELWIADVNGTLVVLDGAYYEGTPPAVVDELHAIMRSIQITPGT